MVNSYEKRGRERFRHVNESLRINGNGMVLIVVFFFNRNSDAFCILLFKIVLIHPCAFMCVQM